MSEDDILERINRAAAVLAENDVPGEYHLVGTLTPEDFQDLINAIRFVRRSKYDYDLDTGTYRETPCPDKGLRSVVIHTVTGSVGLTTGVKSELSLKSAKSVLPHCVKTEEV